MKPQELINKLSNILASETSGADVKITDKDVATITLNKINGVKTLIIAGEE